MISHQDVATEPHYLVVVIWMRFCLCPDIRPVHGKFDAFKCFEQAYNLVDSILTLGSNQLQSYRHSLVTVVLQLLQSQQKIILLKAIPVVNFEIVRLLLSGSF